MKEKEKCLYKQKLSEYVSDGTKVRLFADDSAIYRKIKTPLDHQILQNDIRQLEKWETTWSMKFHPDKCQLLRTTTKRKPSSFN